MSTSTVSGLQSALRLYESDKVRERADGQSRIREIFSNKENLLVFQVTAARDGGAGWIAFFQCLFQVVVLEKKTCLRKAAGPQAERRLADAISLVRWMAERSVHLISRKPFLSLLTHMTHVLVYSAKVFPPAALDYAKAIRTLLSYPPHLEALDQQSWKVLMGICWAAVLGDDVTVEDDWDDEINDDDMKNGSTAPTPSSTYGTTSFGRGKVTVTQATTELTSLIPILLSGTSAPLVSSLPSNDGTYQYEPSLGYSILLKTNRYFSQYPTEISSHLAILRSLNIVLANLELNCRQNFVSGSLKLLPQLVNLWNTRNKAIREQVLISLRMMVPFLTHKTALEKDKMGTIRDSFERLISCLPKETASRWGIEPIDLSVLRFVSGNDIHKETGYPKPFRSSSFVPGFDFSHDSAMRWATLELYSECGFHLYRTIEPPHTFTQSRSESPQSKRRKVNDVLVSLVSGTGFGPSGSRLHHLQVLVLLIDRQWANIHLEAQIDIRQRLVSMLDEEDTLLQSWAFIALATLAARANQSVAVTLDFIPVSPSQRHGSEDADMHRVWYHAIRKLPNESVSRAAAHAALSLLSNDKIGATQAVNDIGSLLRNVDIQGPSYPHDSICALLDKALTIARLDVRLYSMNLEDKMISWLAKWNAVEGTRGKGRLDQHVPSDFLPLLDNMCHLKVFPISDQDTIGALPDCAIVDRILEEDRTQPIRRFNLHALISDQAESPVFQQAITSHGDLPASTSFLEDRPRRVSDILTGLLQAFCADWPTSTNGLEARPAIPPDRCRRAIDMIVLTASFQATLQLNGFTPDSTCLQQITKLLDMLKTHLRSTSYDIPSQYMIWSGFEPLIHINGIQAPVWPVLLRPNAESGIRQDLLPAGRGPEDPAGRGENGNGLLEAIWNLLAVSSSLKTLFETCLELFAGSDNVQMQSGTQYINTPAADDDDFGDIRTAETDAMPLSKEAIECHRVTSSLLTILALFRLRGSTMSSPSRLVPKDSALINAFLSSEGRRMVERGNVLCYAVKAGSLRLNLEAVDLIFSSLEEMLSSYAYSRDEGLLTLSLDFMACSASIWLAEENASSDLADRIVYLAKFLASKSARGQISSWRVRLALLLFVDEYLDYDPDMVAWSRLDGDGMVVDDASSGATGVISDALIDVDMRVRFRAATSAAGLLHLSSIPLDQHLPFYHATVDSLPREPRHWDSFLTDILWKLNCCVTSSQLRAATTYHIYEMPISTSEFNHHLQVGLETVSHRLGLPGIAPLYLAHAPLIISSQIYARQSPMRVPHELCGFPTRKAFAISTLEVAAPALLLSALAETSRNDVGAGMFNGAQETYIALCNAAGMMLSDVTSQHLSATAAWALCDPHSNLFRDPAGFSRDAAFDMLASLPGIPPKSKAKEMLQPLVDDIASHSFALVDLTVNDQDIIKILDAVNTKLAAGSKTYQLLIPEGGYILKTALALSPGVAAHEVIETVQYMQTRFPNLSTAKTLLNTLVRLFHRINEDFLVDDQHRHLRAIAIVVAMYASDMNHPTILRIFLGETIPLLKLPNVCDRAFHLLKWGFDQIHSVPKTPEDLESLMMGLGQIYEFLPDDEEERPGVRSNFKAWITEKTPIWNDLEALGPSLRLAKSVWPPSLFDCLKDVSNSTFGDLCEQVDHIEIPEALSLCKSLKDAIEKTDLDLVSAVETFQQSAFWHLKRRLHASNRIIDPSPFLDLLYIGHGKVHPPNLDEGKRSNAPDRLAVIRSRLKEDPTPILQAAIVEQVVKMTRTDSFQERSKALRILQVLQPSIVDLTNRSILSSASVDLLSLLKHITATTTASPSAPFTSLAQDEMWIKRSRDFAVWSKSLASFLCNALSQRQAFFSAIVPLFDTIQSSAKDLLPLLVQCCLSCYDATEMTDLKERFRTLSSYFSIILQYPTADIETIRAVVNIILHLRQFHPPYRTDELGYESWLEVDSMLLSEAALRCGSYATALMFLELARLGKKGYKTLDLYDARVQKIMYETYSNVEDPDGFYGIRNQDVGDALHRRLQHEEDHWRAFGLHSAAVETGLTTMSNQPASLLAMRDLHNLGFNRVSRSVFGSTRDASQATQSEDSGPLLFELAWRTGDWDLPVAQRATQHSEALIYATLRAVHRERDLDVARKSVQSAIFTEIDHLRECGVERITVIKKVQTNLLCLREISNWLEPEVQGAIDRNELNHETLVDFTTLSPSFSFADAERLMATRRSLISAAKERESQNVLGDLVSPKTSTLVALEIRCLLRLGEMARTECNVQAAINALVAAQYLERGNAPSDPVQDEFSQVLWAQQEHSLAIQHVEERMKPLRSSKDNVGGRLTVLLSRVADWTSKAKLRAPHDVNVLFEEATKLSQAHKIPSDEQSQLYHDYATFADHHQEALYRSPELERLNSYVGRKEVELKSAISSASSRKTVRSSARTDAQNQIERVLQEDEQAINDLLSERTAYATTALKMYASALTLSDKYDDSTTRMCSLWLEHDTEDDVNKAFSDSLNRIPSHKFIFLSPQLAARLDRPKAPIAFNNALNGLMLRISRQHPYHILYQVITLADGFQTPSNVRRNSDAGAEGRAPAAAAILATIAADTHHPLARTAGKQMKLLADCATSWCLSRNKEEEAVSTGKPMIIPADCPLKRLQNLNIPIPTSPPPIDPQSKYEGISTLARYRSSYAVLGGIHRPKKMQVLDSNQRTHKQLFKGEDELRQDAVMEQVFEMSNKLLTRDRKTRERNLRFRTYVVIPLAKKTGIMEFVGDSQAIGEWLKPAHNRYGKINGDISADDFRKKLKPLQEKDKNWPQLTPNFMSMMERFHPVMRHFFAEKHRDPVAWFTMRLNYTCSVAVTSMVGWVLGIGDRHCSNILIDQKTGELVHIDFGIVFEDGRRLRIPEKVPFRLTNDIVDGFGLTGVDGTFRRCSEHTLRVLRESSELIMTVLEVFKHDPLYAWDADPDKLQRAQGGGNVTVGTSASALEKADRILSKIKSKLRDDLSIEYTVNQLIQEARDVDNLAKIFVGWQPWL